MHCEDAARALYAGETSQEIEVHLSACDECRLLAEDLGGLANLFARARAEWAPRPGFRVALPAAPWKKLAIAACLLVLPLAGMALWSLRPAPPDYDVGTLIEPGAQAAPSTDRELLAAFFLEDSQP
jgi:hypothetical protein